jgi:hypothetical protein
MSEKREQEGKERKQPGYDAQTDLAFISIYVQVQTTWAVLILAFLAGLLALLATVQPRIGLTSIPVIILYQVLLGALWYSARRFFVATSVVKRAKDAFAQNHPGASWMDISLLRAIRFQEGRERSGICFCILCDLDVDTI